MTTFAFEACPMCEGVEGYWCSACSGRGVVAEMSWATYVGNTVAMADERYVLGPNDLEEYVMAVEATFDPVVDKTRVGFVIATVEQVVAAARECRLRP